MTTPIAQAGTESGFDALEEAVGAYWDCAYQEGHLGRQDGDKANAILHEIRRAATALVAEERARWEPAAEKAYKALCEESAAYDEPLSHAPGHAHAVPGVWDDDNGELAGKRCAWCATWAKAKAMGLTTPNARVDRPDAALCGRSGRTTGCAAGGEDR
jgi:hypothetical protein